MTGAQWYYRVGPHEFGPVGREDLLQYLEAGKLARETLVRREGSERWVAADEALEEERPTAPAAHPISPAPEERTLATCDTYVSLLSVITRNRVAKAVLMLLSLAVCFPLAFLLVVPLIRSTIVLTDRRLLQTTQKDPFGFTRGYMALWLDRLESVAYERGNFVVTGIVGTLLMVAGGVMAVSVVMDGGACWDREESMLLGAAALGGMIGCLMMVFGFVVRRSAFTFRTATAAIHATIGHMREEDVRAFVQQVEAQREAVTRPPLLT